MMNEGRLRVKARRFLALMLCVLLTFGPICRYAVADDYESGGGGSHGFGGSNPSWGTVWYGPNSTSNLAGTTYYQYGVVANTKYDAAIYNLSINESIYGELTNKKKSKLLTTDNAFTDFADTFKVGKPELDPSLIFNTDYAVVSAWKSACDLYGETYCYSSMYTLAQKQAARDYVIGILGESDGGGGSGGVGSGGGGSSSDLTTSIPLYYMGNGSEFAGDQPTLVLQQSFLDSLSQSMIDNNRGYWAITINQDNGDLNIWLSNHDFSLYLEDNKLKYFVFDESSNLSNYNYRNFSYTINGNEITFKSNYLGSLYGKSLTYNNDIGKYVYGMGNVGYSSDKSRISGGDDDPVEPPVTWPDPPTSPTVDPPEVPNPPDPTPPDPPDPTPPDPPTPWIPIPGPDDDPITGEDFQDLLDALAEHCQHIRDAMSDNFEQLWTNQSELLVTEFASTRDTLTDNLQWLGNDIIAAGFTDLSAYLNDLFDWLAEQMQFNVNVDTNQYDDSSIIYWLKRIWSKLGSGDITTRPTDPNVDNDGWWEWLSGLLGGLVGALADIGLDKLGGLVDALDTLKDKFPFCIPWDVAALLALLVSEPVAPVVSVPMYALTATDGVQQVGSMTIDLDTYSTAWEAVRWIERIGFCVYLAMRSKDFLDLLGKIKG